MKTTIQKNILHSILAEADDIKSIFDFVSSKYKSVDFTATCNDGSQLETTKIQDILSFENLNYRKVEVISCVAFGETNDEAFVLVLEDKKGISAELHLTSDNDEKALYISQEIIKRLLDTKPNYDWVARIPVIAAVMSVLMVLWLLLQIAVVTGVAELKYSIGGVEYFNNSIFMAIVLLGVTYPIEKLKQYLFPKVFFLIGKQKKTMETIQKVRSFIFITVILSLVLGLLTNWLSNVVF